MEQQITCINCPVGCRLQVVVENGEVKSVTGNSCNRGITYAKQECVAPRRMVTAVVPVEDRRVYASAGGSERAASGAYGRGGVSRRVWNRRGRDRHQDRGVIFNPRNESDARPTGRAL